MSQTNSEVKDDDRYVNTSFVSRNMIEKWRDSAKNLIYHFRGVLKGMVPFLESWTPDMQTSANIDSESLTYIRETAKILEVRSKYYPRSYMSWNECVGTESFYRI
jgi:hypothetical protein